MPKQEFLLPLAVNTRLCKRRKIMIDKIEKDDAIRKHAVSAVIYAVARQERAISVVLETAAQAIKRVTDNPHSTNGDILKACEIMQGTLISAADLEGMLQGKIAAISGELSGSI